MRKDEYLNILSDRLNVLPAEEYRDIMEYYTEYFAEAGEENEEEVIRELGDVEELAERILSENNVQSQQQYNGQDGTYIHMNAYGQGGQAYTQMSGQPYAAQQTYMSQQPYAPQQQLQKTGLSTGWKVFIAIVTFPIWIGIVSAVAGMIFGFGVGAVACFFAAITTIVVGISVIGSNVAGCILFIGAGLIVLTVAMVLLLASVGMAHLVGKVFKAIFGKRQQPQYM